MCLWINLSHTNRKREGNTMDLKLQVKQSQVLSQRMIQSAEILQMTSQELNTYINDLALENPVIDIVEPAAGDSQKESIEQQQWLNSFNEENYYLYQRQNNDDDYDFKDTWNINTDEGETLADYLWSQLISEDFSEQETEIIHFCLDSLDNRGYLTETQEDIAAYFKTDTETIDRILEELKSLDPAGVCAFNLEECLKLQLERKKMLTPVMESLIDNHLDMVAKNQIPGIEVNSYYRQMNQAPDSQELKEYLGNKIRQAEWVKQCITQRSKTMMDVSRVILERQEAFFSHGPNYLKPLRMTDIAEILGIHESTVSRAVSKKYLQCSWGVYPMNFFFSRNVGTSTSSTEKSDDPSKAVTARKIKQLLHEIIAEENKKKPYSDRLLGEKLTEKGISISRRTVAKYREEEGIPDASGRKEYT